MKKLVATAAVAAMLGSAAFADVSVGAWGKAVVGIGNGTKASGDGTDVVISNTQAWGGNGPRSGITFSGDHDGTIGFTAQAFWNGADFGIGDCAYLWYQPLEQLKVWVGKDNCGNPLRGDACYGTWDMYRVGTMAGAYHEGWTFMGQSSTGAAIGVFPIEGLSFYASMDYPYRDDLYSGSTTYKTKADGTTVYAFGDGYLDKNLNYYDADDVEESSSSKLNKNLAEVLGRSSKFSLAYDIEGVGAIKLGLEEKGKVATNKDGEAKDQNIISASFELKAVENLTFNVGAFIPMVQYAKKGDSDASAAGSDISEMYSFNRVNAYVKYGVMDGFNVHAQFGTKLNAPDVKKEKADGQLGFLVAGGVDYKIMDDLTLYADAGYANGVYMKNTTEDKSDCVNFGLGVTKDYGEGCSVSAGFVGATNGYGMYSTEYKKDNGDTEKAFSWGIPLVITYSF